MPEISALLERAAAEPTGAPNVDGPYRRYRRARIAGGVAVVVAIVAVPTFFVVRPDEKRSEVRTIIPNEDRPEVRHDVANRYSVVVPDGWHVAGKQLAPWLGSPHDILNVATTELEPSPLPSNQAICPSEIPNVIANGIGDDGASLTIREWSPGVGLYVAEPRPLHASDLDWQPGCDLPRGMTNFGATFRDRGRDFTVQMVLGVNAQAKRKTLEGILDSFRLDLPAGWSWHLDAVKGVAVVVPAGWKVAATEVTPQLTDPKEVLALGTGDLVPDLQGCAHIPVGPIHALAADDVVVWVAMRALPVPHPEPTDRPRTLGPTDGTADSDLPACLDATDRGRVFQRWIYFADHGNDVYIAVAMGPDVTPERRAQVWDVVNSLQFAALTD